MKSERKRELFSPKEDKTRTQNNFNVLTQTVTGKYKNKTKWKGQRQQNKTNQKVEEDRLKGGEVTI